LPLIFLLLPQTGGPRWDVRLGREDSLTASQEDSDNIMPSPRANATALIRLFATYHLSVIDLVALSGSHSIGEARCFSIMFRLYNQSGSGRPDPHMDPAYRASLDKLCPLTVDQNVTGGMDSTPVVFDNQYFKDLVNLRGFLNSDQTLFSDNPFTQVMVKRFSEDQDAFFRAFADGMVKMGELQNPRKGEIRLNCRVANGSPPPLKSQAAPFRLLDF
jgi:peroxidase